ncbi:MAG: hypothetical protein Q9213_002121 [Squamulea squamosa]
MIPDNSNPGPDGQCPLYQQAMFRIWVEDNPLWKWQKYWAAEENQLITDFANYDPLRKRAECVIPTSLPQASTASDNADTKSLTAAKADETQWFKLGPRVRTADSSTSGGSKSPTLDPTPTPSQASHETTMIPLSTTLQPSTITPPPSLPSGTLSCGSDSPDINTESITALISNLCNGLVGEIGNPTVNAVEPTAAVNDIPSAAKEVQVINNLYAVLAIDRPNCATATFDLSASASACSTYLASITSSCTQGGGLLTSAGCFDWGVKAFIIGKGDGTW